MKRPELNSPSRSAFEIESRMLLPLEKWFRPFLTFSVGDCSWVVLLVWLRELLKSAKGDGSFSKSCSVFWCRGRLSLE